MFCCRHEGKYVKSDKMKWLIEPGSKVGKNIIIFNDEEGTLWWQAMNIWQSATVHGAFVIHSKHGTTGGFPFSKPYGDIPIILGEWWKKDVKEVFLEYIPSASGIMNSDAFTVNGQPGDFYPCSNNGTFKILVDIGKTYLLRIVNAAIGKTFYFGIAKHNLTVIAMDGSPITKPFTTDYVELTAQQSIDCIFEANQQTDYYYIVAGAYAGQTYDTNKTTTAIVEYQGNYTPSSPPFLPNNFNYQYNKSSNRNYLYVILTFVVLGLFFSTAISAIFFGARHRRPNWPLRSAMVTPM